VFFKPIRDNADGPLGVPLSAGRSIAVDPRTTPLGTPVYLSARTGATGGLKGLFIAQDTGSAISGAQRADLYSGSGTEAERVASTLKAPARPWVLLPAGLNLASHGSGLRTTRGGESGGNFDCIVDDDFCVDYDNTP
jgi:membrane-bound lytic murein transglycosylase A